MTLFRCIKFLPLLSVFLLNSCIGLAAGISVRGNGSGTMTLEYRISRAVEALGKMDGNARWQTVPAGKADFDRSLERLPGLRLASFSSRDDGTDIINRVKLEFQTIEALIPFLAGTAQGASLTEENGKKQLTLILYPGITNGDPELLSLIRELSRPYAVDLSFSAARGAALSLTDGAGRPLAAAEGIRVQGEGKKVSLSVKTGDLLSSPEGLGAVISWTARQ
jgi:hypothetical protein